MSCFTIVPTQMEVQEETVKAVFVDFIKVFLAKYLVIYYRIGMMFLPPIYVAIVMMGHPI